MPPIIEPTREEIRRYARGALRKADVLDVVPVPLDIVTDALGLTKEDLFDVGLETMPDKMKRAAAKFSGLILGALSKEKVLYINSSETGPRSRFTQAHELGHESLPWHSAFFYVDDKTTLDPSTKLELEAEANAFAAELLFGLDRFETEADAYAPSLGVPLQLSNRFGVSRHAALRRYAQTSRHAVALITMGRNLVGAQPGFPVILDQCETSAAFVEKYGALTALIGRRMTTVEHPSVVTLAEMSHAVHDEPVDIVLDTKRGKEKFQGHLFFNRYCRFILLTKPRRLGRKIQAIPA
ncbi:ImmA/IrrE family metallo-endopeptidase [Arthrobacter sp. AET 35A]|uniref:ImmA/IrrE family metallo-endopeptidase n=1 Tax=Arthrobacter sp. AET 35A TaxID=2292643 RepID=UPI001782ECC2|nr:ImmA/IrrE family metallo-endopeptidase [Arthrobacter sp. AET 35A]MBE0011674.1 ImmA/IrrE family metallo-endopeptidase [Arthrobacter sp. AET 35A]